MTARIYSCENDEETILAIIMLLIRSAYISSGLFSTLSITRFPMSVFPINFREYPFEGPAESAVMITKAYGLLKC